MIIKHNVVFVFDLDDTLFKEIDFLKSAYEEISEFVSLKTGRKGRDILDKMLSVYYDGANPFEKIVDLSKSTEVSTAMLLSIYRNHKPKITLSESNKTLLKYLKDSVFKIGLITDGRSIQQRNKIEALGLSDFFDDIIISEEFGSEKPSYTNYNYFFNKYGENYKYIYVGDNTSKDFVAPNALNWISVCLIDNGENIHKQTFDLQEKYKPLFKISSLKQICEILKKVE